MKPLHAALLAMAGLLALLNNPLNAQQQPMPLEPESAPKAIDPSPPPSREPPPTSGRPRGLRQGQEEPTAYIGVLTANVPRELRAHFGLSEGFGLLVQEVMPDTPAQAAGIQDDDILIRFEDQKLVNMEQLQTLVRSKKKDDLVSMTLISAGVEKQVTVRIEERMMPVESRDPRDDYFQPFYRGDRNRPDMNDMRDSLERYQKQMREYQERMRDWRREDNNGTPPTSPLWDGGRRRSDSDSRTEPRTVPDSAYRPPSPGRPRESANVTRSDDSGIYSLRQEGERMIFSAKPKEGVETSWDVSNPDERRSIPAPMQEKLRQLEEIRGSD
ncbi:PDZ domain-containing protein [Prosthecobacter fusiformis]|uniref:PDZ domain-containing protein n=1 Tax=Prosthecobacter fusiformis TaxID=48464 RepID=A0A4R7SSC8_9BACT|nr:PDZ domain-containing protein [Prosthecobacter fusiformis]TDU81078.1 PDZ domain-containing protein [Prosthecobacter fusiformis]